VRGVVDVQSRKFTLRDLDLVASEVGAHNQDAVLFLHGAGQTRHSWSGALRTLDKAGYHLLSLDQRGHGESDWAKNGDYSSDAFIGDLRQVIEQLNKPVFLVGASMGGLVSLMSVGEAPETPQAKVRGLALVDITPRIEPEGKTRVLGFMQSNPNGFASVEEAAAAVSRYRPGRPPRRDLSGLRRNLRLAEDGRYYWHWDPAFFEDPNATHGDPEERYASAAAAVNIPTLIVRGARSELVSEESVRHMRELIPAARYVDISGASHMVAGDGNEAFTDAIMEFLKDIGRL
jgi:pimeloyl-ACP methyl ester carboxylesterase